MAWMTIWRIARFGIVWDLHILRRGSDTMKCQVICCQYKEKYAKESLLVGLKINTNFCEEHYLYCFDQGHGNAQKILKEAKLAPEMED